MFDLIPMNNRERGLFRYFDNFEREFFRNMMPSAAQFNTDIVDAGDKYVLSAELPGFHREDIKIDLNEDCLTISATHNEEVEENKDSYIRRERRFGAFSRSFDVSGIRVEGIAAKYENGILSLELPKAEAAPVPPSRRIEIQ